MSSPSNPKNYTNIKVTVPPPPRGTPEPVPVEQQLNVLAIAIRWELFRQHQWMSTEW